VFSDCSERIVGHLDKARTRLVGEPASKRAMEEWRVIRPQD